MKQGSNNNEKGTNGIGATVAQRSVWGTHRGLSFGEVDVRVQQHGNVLVSGLQRYGEGVTLVLRGGTGSHRNQGWLDGVLQKARCLPYDMGRRFGTGAASNVFRLLNVFSHLAVSYRKQLQNGV